MRSFIILLAINCFAITANAEGAKLCHIANAGFYATDGKNGVYWMHYIVMDLMDLNKPVISPMKKWKMQRIYLQM
ncbi:hypothetical protein N8742_03875 [Emcibacteraceae bacterium]|nr:hypothetical protein [Emcibacteraceae bacterium]MDA9553411.1 hypothetical protein [Emcibacteraceae bacterium]